MHVSEWKKKRRGEYGEEWMCEGIKEMLEDRNDKVGLNDVMKECMMEGSVGSRRWMKDWLKECIMKGMKEWMTKGSVRMNPEITKGKYEVFYYASAISVFFQERVFNWL